MKLVLFAITMLFAVGSEPAYTPTSGYEPMQIEGFRILLNKELKSKEPELTQQVIKELTCQLHQINRKIPRSALEHLKGTTIWVELDSPKCAEHHPSRQWLIENNYNPDKTGCVEIGNARHFVNWTKDQPYMVLHEMAHYYHWKVLGYGHPEIKKQYKEAVQSGSYEKILHINGKHVRAYAMNNEKEYFAETTEAFFGTNDMYPFVRSELKVHDPNMYTLLEQLWNNPPSSVTEKASPSSTKSKIPKPS
jgi:hypothetical protein